MRKRVVIIGGGASGMMAALAAKKYHGEVVILEHTDRLGRKLLSTGNGKCNYTNLLQEASCYRSDSFSCSFDVIRRFPAEETLAFFQDLGVYPKERNGYVYPYSGQASGFLDCLRFAVEKSGVTVKCSTTVSSVRKKDGLFVIDLEGQSSLQADALILACGGKAAPGTGSDGSGYQLAKAMGHHIVTPVPALVQLHAKEPFLKQLAGVRTEGEIRLFVEEREVAKDRGELQFTAYGISGIPVFQVSRYAAKALEKRQKVTALLDLLPGLPFGEVQEYLATHKPWQYPGLLNKKILQALTPSAKTLKALPVTIIKTNGFENAQVTAGGVSGTEICPETMESRLVPGLYFAGELIDVDGICGGYNLQWAWSSGYLAGSSAAKKGTL